MTGAKPYKIDIFNKMSVCQSVKGNLLIEKNKIKKPQIFFKKVYI